MTLLLNYRPVLRQPTGIGVYANAVLPALQELPHYLIPGGEEGTAQQRLKRLAWSQFQLPRLAKRHDASLIFTPAPEGYLGPQTIPQVVMVHDLRPMSHPERSLQSLYFRNWVPPLLRSCRQVLTNSQFTAQEIERCTGLPERCITTIALGYDERLFYPVDMSADGAKRQHYLLHVGQPYPHKNLRRLILAFSELAPRYPELQLLCVGKPHPHESSCLKSLVDSLGLRKSVKWQHYVTASELPNLYRGALAFVYPSLWEGFGLPVLEAMACGTPVITSYGSGTEEVLGDAGLLVDPLSQGELREAIQQLLDQPSLRNSLRERGFQRAAKYSWSKTAAATRKQLDRHLH